MGRPTKEQVAAREAANAQASAEAAPAPVARRKRIEGPDKTVIKFKFLKAGPAFSIEEHGNFNPTMKVMFKVLPQVAGNYAEVGYDLDAVHTITLKTERPRDLPADFTDDDDNAVRTAYRIKQAEAAAAQHEANNKVRDELYYHEKQGTIEILSDSFMDDPTADIPSMTVAV